MDDRKEIGIQLHLKRTEQNTKKRSLDLQPVVELELVLELELEYPPWGFTNAFILLSCFGIEVYQL